MLKRALLYLVVMSILLALAVNVGQWDKSTALLQQQASEISAWLKLQESETQKGGGVGTLLIHQGDTLLSWSNTNILPANRDLKVLSEKTGYHLLHLPQGYFLARVEKKRGRYSQHPHTHQI